MKQSEQIQFVKELTKTIEQDIFNAILDGKIPEDWDGIELRWLLADRFERASFAHSPARRKKYINIVLVNNL